MKTKWSRVPIYEAETKEWQRWGRDDHRRIEQAESLASEKWAGVEELRNGEEIRKNHISGQSNFPSIFGDC